ncbi:GNAT family N-acetyltransferase [Streptomyces sp. M2CJ-2]|uniref:GNAT family N-acetyltransferase n=1 Tax=Streptomyces sp. M2CJ-2 TaxID=2803948 RepID=UPI0019254E77|nr:GNAT family N-acetyltransferase [Streptomyces sp. M2CJ-2]MBL3669435.1 GNAT family N-acetyltransferase [Streptomyces sp. M2CJ-2]
MPALHPPSVRVRNVVGQDMPDLLRLDREVFPDDPMPHSILRQFVDMFADHLLVAEDENGRLCAYVLATPPHKGRSWIVGLGVASAVRRRGLAEQLMLESLENLRTEGAHTVLLWVEPTNKPATALYDSLGFVPDREGPRPDHFGPGADRILMTLHTTP